MLRLNYLSDQDLDKMIFYDWGRSLPKLLPSFLRGFALPRLWVCWKGTFCVSPSDKNIRNYFKLIQTLIVFVVLCFQFSILANAALLNSPSLAKPGLLNESEFYTGIQKVTPQQIHTLLQSEKS